MIYTHSELHFTKMSALGTVYTLSAKSLTARFKILPLYFTVTVTYECRNFETLKEKALKSGTVRLWFELCKTKHWGTQISDCLETTFSVKTTHLKITSFELYKLQSVILFDSSLMFVFHEASIVTTIKIVCDK